jgi:murein L,D-transpeptidase YcbB/YkuD
MRSSGIALSGLFPRAAGGTAALALALMLSAPAAAQMPATAGGVLAVQTALPALNAFRQAVAVAAAGDEAVADFYRDRDYRPIWTGAADADRRSTLLTALSLAGAHALPAARFDPAALIAELHAARSETDRGRAEVAMTAAYLDYARAVGSGVLEPGRIDPGLVREVPRRDPRVLLDGIAGADPAGFLRNLPPRNPEYARLMKARMALERQIARGGWGDAVPARSLAPGATGPVVVALRDRLIHMGYLGRTATQTYDATLQRAVQAFQFDHGLVADGIAGEPTMAEINVDPAARHRAVTVAMERERWLNQDRGRRHIWVNLADFSAKILDDGKVTFATRAVVGANNPSDKRTPEFSAMMTYMELNPDWTVPPGIIRRDYLPKLQANPNALRHLQIVDARGRVVSRDAIDFSAYSSRNFPFNLRQPPGASNALGKVKFMFPNRHAIYLHDTPDKHLFDREVRTYSSGCIRLNDPFDFAYALLARQTETPRQTFHAVLDSGRQERMFLDEPVPVHLDYRTAFTDAKGRVQYRRDIYGRDALIHAALLRAGVAEPGERG